ncbi:SdpI family protein [Actinomyces sp.]|uniref:SdpI family protein n=1 Tax=Actinomyces sp. TaxID=29317 RepID=UPI0026DAE962|nr:SdpI family protein [Actinomyces sp.]MDO4901681.1 SdpI family protein [Actinomyces sp.]
MTDLVSSIVLACLMVIIGVLSTVVGLKMRKGSLKPNSLVGVRTPQAYRSDADWYQIQSASARPVLIMGAMGFDSAVLFVVQELIPEAIPFIVPVIITILQMIISIAMMWCAATTVTKR